MGRQRVLVTGATGFVGRSLVRQAVEAGWDVMALVLPGDGDAASLRPTDGSSADVHLLEGSLDDIDRWQAKAVTFAPEACVHLAWTTAPGVYLDTPDNLKWLTHSNDLFARLPAWGVKHIVGVGTCAEYDADYGYLRESTPTRPDTLYAASKLATRMVGRQLAVRAGVAFSWARIFHLYGPGEHPRRLVASCMKALLNGERFEATEGRQVRDFLHVDDVASGICRVLSSAKGEDVNICSAEPVAVRDVLQLIARTLGHTELLALGSRQSPSWDPPFLCGDNVRLRSYGWLPKFSLESGIDDALRWWRRRI